MNFALIVQDYKERFRRPAAQEMRDYATKPSLKAAIREAGLSRFPDGKRHPHQRRIPGRVLKSAETALQASAPALRGSSSFLQLHRRIEHAIGSIHGIGALAVYDIAHRIGAYLGHSPELVYLHAGTREGAKALGIGGKTVHPRTLPREFHQLSPAEIEDCLCIYKSVLRSRGKLKACLPYRATTRSCSVTS